MRTARCAAESPDLSVITTAADGTPDLRPVHAALEFESRPALTVATAIARRSRRLRRRTGQFGSTAGDVCKRYLKA